MNISNRAIFLDIHRSAGASAIVIWNARVLHQGFTLIPGPSGFQPLQVRPKIFRIGDEAWIKHLAEYGYVVVGDVVSRAAVQSAAELLLRDI